MSRGFFFFFFLSAIQISRVIQTTISCFFFFSLFHAMSQVQSHYSANFKLWNFLFTHFKSNWRAVLSNKKSILNVSGSSFLLSGALKIFFLSYFSNVVNFLFKKYPLSSCFKKNKKWFGFFPFFFENKMTTKKIYFYQKMGENDFFRKLWKKFVKKWKNFDNKAPKMKINYNWR